MGYTHYFTQGRDYTAEEWQQVTEDITILLDYTENEQGVALRDGDGTGRPTINGDLINFNGAGDDAHENFFVERVRVPNEYDPPGAPLGRNFCKTARKPYDIAVTAALCYLATVAETHAVGSDGNGRDWLAGLELARQALPRYANMLDIPRDILKEDRWVYPWFRTEPDGYTFALCIDGRAYIVDPKGRSYRFYSHHEAARWATSHTEKPIKMENWLGEPVTEGGKGLFEASGSFNAKRNAALERQQRVLFDAMIAKAEGDRAIPPPAYARPDDLAKLDETPRARTLKDLLELADA